MKKVAYKFRLAFTPIFIILKQQVLKIILLSQGYDSSNAFWQVHDDVLKTAK